MTVDSCRISADFTAFASAEPRQSTFRDLLLLRKTSRPDPANSRKTSSAPPKIRAAKDSQQDRNPKK
jgi:hypothetical protein